MTTCLTMDGGLNLRTVEAAQQMILEALGEADAVELVLPDGVSVDLCGVQLIESARVHARAVGKAIALRHTGERLRALLEDAGFLTDASPETLCFWFQEGPVQ